MASATTLAMEVREFHSGALGAPRDGEGQVDGLDGKPDFCPLIRIRATSGE